MVRYDDSPGIRDGTNVVLSRTRDKSDVVSSGSPLGVAGVSTEHFPCAEE